jgi:hypothetical protein
VVVDGELAVKDVVLRNVGDGAAKALEVLGIRRSVDLVLAANDVAVVLELSKQGL